MVTAILSWFGGVITQGASWLLSTVFYIFGWFGGWVAAFANWAWGYCMALIPASWAEFLRTDFIPADVWTYLGIVQYWIPVSQGFGIIVTVVTLQATIRLARWMFALVPTLGG